MSATTISKMPGEIKVIAECHNMLISKIDDIQDKITTMTTTMTSDLKSCVDEFCNKMNDKLKNIEIRFHKNKDELDNIRKELTSKKFDESNFNNVSMLKNAHKQITEKDIKIQELENRIRLLESNSSKVSANIAKKTVSATIHKKNVNELSLMPSENILPVETLPIPVVNIIPVLESETKKIKDDEEVIVKKPKPKISKKKWKLKLLQHLLKLNR